MENAAHTLSGLVLARLGPDRHGPWATALLVTAANFPDVDGISILLDQQTYLRWHHGITHSVLGLAIAGSPSPDRCWRGCSGGSRPDGVMTCG